MSNHHITKPVLIGEIQGNGQFNIVSQTPGLVVAQEWSPTSLIPRTLSGLAGASQMRCVQLKTGTCTAGKKLITFLANKGRPFLRPPLFFFRGRSCRV